MNSLAGQPESDKEFHSALRLIAHISKEYQSENAACLFSLSLLFINIFYKMSILGVSASRIINVVIRYFVFHHILCFIKL